jgi:Flp pilus assembly secretin CpaC
VPGLGDLPVLGALFRSVRYTNKETELVVLVTARLVEPMSIAHRPPVPGVMHTPPDDWELYAEGLIEGSAPARVSQTDAAWLKQMGLSKLKGPGAWADYEVGPARSRSTVRLCPPAGTADQPAPTTKPSPAK